MPEDRQHDGLVGPFTVAENLVLDTYDREPFGAGLALRIGEIRRNAQQRVDEFDIRTPSIDATASTLSGGNQQKVVLAREMSRPLKVFVASQPTRGVDVGAQEFIHRRIVAERDNGTPVVIVSTELDEVLALADRIAVMYRGRIIGVAAGRCVQGRRRPDDGRCRARDGARRGRGASQRADRVGASKSSRSRSHDRNGGEAGRAGHGSRAGGAAPTR